MYVGTDIIAYYFGAGIIRYCTITPLWLKSSTLEKMEMNEIVRGEDSEVIYYYYSLHKY